jgi:hypothetical protein
MHRDNTSERHTRLWLASRFTDWVSLQNALPPVVFSRVGSVEV